ncbi:SpoIIE family protein phosphatase [Kitasatospora sp. NPDC059463]|uniref:SpoIIE family protein phosphatase n=1 Tax=unclassified Kitasatospora TaxID=2633591 RepID=UPI00368A80BE
MPGPSSTAGQDPPRPATTPGAEETAVLREAVDRLRTEAEGLRRAMRSRGVIEQAKGMLTERLGCTPDEAFAYLVHLSQDTNRKVVDLAAGLVGVAAPPPEDAAAPRDGERAPAGPPLPEGEEPAAAFPEQPEPPRPLPHPPGGAARARVQDLAALFHLASSALASADTPEDLARVLHEVALAPVGVIAVVLGLLEPDGALALVAGHGVPAQRLSQWRRIPPETGVPLVSAAHGGGMVWEFDPPEGDAGRPVTGRIVPGRSACAVPLHHAGRIIGAMSLGWAGPAEQARSATRYVNALAGPVGVNLLRVAAGDGGEPALPVPGGEAWLRGVLDATFSPVLALSAVRPGGRGGPVTDLRVAYANRAAVGPGPSAQGRRLSELHPGLVATGTFARILRAAVEAVPHEGPAEGFSQGTGGPERAVTIRATPFLDGLLLTWRPRRGPVERAAHLAEAQRLSGVGSFRWSTGDPGPDCSREALRLLGLGGGQPAVVPLAGLLHRVCPEDRPAAGLLVRRLLAGQHLATLEFGVVGAPGAAPRVLRVVAESLADPGGGRARTVNGVVEDVTGRRHADDQLTAVRSRLAEQRRRAAAEHRAARALRTALTAASSVAEPETGGPESAVRPLRGAENPRSAGDLCDLLRLPGGRYLLAVGGVGRRGPVAAVRAGEVRNGLRALAHTGAGPAELLDVLNAMLGEHNGHRTVGAVCALYDPRAGELLWTAADEVPPLLLRDGGAAFAPGPVGPALGARPGARYDQSDLSLRPGDVLLFATLGRPVHAPAADRTARLLLDAADPPDCAGPAALPAHLDRIAARLTTGPAPVDHGLLLALRVPALPGR